jgi:hypothetical protein
MSHIEEWINSRWMTNASFKAYRAFHCISGPHILVTEDYKQEAISHLLDFPADSDSKLLYTVAFRRMVDYARSLCWISPRIKIIYADTVNYDGLIYRLESQRGYTEYCVIKNVFLDEIGKIILTDKRFDSRDRYILYLYFVEDKKMADIACRVKLATSRISQIIASNIKVLKTILNP